MRFCCGWVLMFRCLCFVFSLCCFSLHVSIFFSAVPRFRCSQTPVMSLKNTPNHNLMQTSIPICFWIVCCQKYCTSTTSYRCCAFPSRLDIACVAIRTNNLWNSFVWFPISPFSNEAKIRCNTMAKTAQRLNRLQNYNDLHSPRNPDACSDL